MFNEEGRVTGKVQAYRGFAASLYYASNKTVS